VGDSRADIAGFYWLALSRGLLSVDSPIAWADAQIMAANGPPDTAIMDLSLASRQPVRHVMDALRALGAPPTPQSFRLFAALLYEMVAGGKLSEAHAANELYALHAQHGRDADEALGREIACIDEYFEPNSFYGVPDAPAAVRAFLSPYGALELPPLK
jgi:hypothetical protein